MRVVRDSCDVRCVSAPLLSQQTRLEERNVILIMVVLQAGPSATFNRIPPL